MILTKNSKAVILIKRKKKNLLRFILAQASYLGFDKGCPPLLENTVFANSGIILKMIVIRNLWNLQKEELIFFFKPCQAQVCFGGLWRRKMSF